MLAVSRDLYTSAPVARRQLLVHQISRNSVKSFGLKKPEMLTLL